MEANNRLKNYFIPVAKSKNLPEYGPEGENILVISPHPDDDVLGAGGIMAEASQKGKRVFSVYITDGGSSPRRDKKTSDSEMACQREKEAISALQILKGHGAFFLRMRSSELPRKLAEGEETLHKIFAYLVPTKIILPSPYERHITHQLCTRMTLQALRKWAKKPALWGYSIWGTFWGGNKRIICDITPFIKEKVQAILAHESQVAYKNYHQGILGKNNYEAIFWESHEVQKASFVEIFLDMQELLQNLNLTLADFVRQDMEAFIKNYL